MLKLKKEQFNLRFQRATGQLENTSRVRVIRRDIARLKTIARAEALRRAGAGAARPTAAADAEETHPRQGRREAEIARQAAQFGEVEGIGVFEMPKRTLHGVVVSDKQDKTVIVRVDRRFTHPTMKKTMRRSKKYHAHDEKNEFCGRRRRCGSRSAVRSPSSSAGKWCAARRKQEFNKRHAV